MNQRTYEYYDFNDWFLKFKTVHPQLIYMKDMKKVLELQELLKIKYKNKVYTTEEVENIYQNYIQKQIEYKIKYGEEEYKKNKYLKELKKKQEEEVNNYIEDLIKEI